MAEVNQYRCQWDGLRGMPGVSTFYSSGLDPTALQAKLVTFFTAIKQYIPNGMTITVPNSGSIVNVETGQNTGLWSAGTPTIIAGTHAGAYAAPSGFVVNWNTSVFRSGRRVRGKTFIVPAGIAIYDTDGSMGTTQLTPIRAAAANVPGGTTPLVVYSRKTASVATCTTADVPDKVVVLRSRRD